METIEIKVLGNLDLSPLEEAFGDIQTDRVIVTHERLRHIQEHHPQDYALFEEYGCSAVEQPDMILRDTGHGGTIFCIKKLPETNLNVVIRLVLEIDNPKWSNSVMTFYRVREKNLRKLMDKHELLYRKE